MKSLVDMVLGGTKPGVFLKSEIRLDSRFLAIPCVYEPEGRVEARSFAVSLRGRKVGGTVDTKLLSFFFGFGLDDKLLAIYSNIKGMEVAEALAFLDNLPVNDPRFRFKSEGRDNCEAPEIAILNGLLLGYNPCCISYYFKINYLGMKQQRLEYIHPADEHVLCHNCIAY